MVIGPAKYCDMCKKPYDDDKRRHRRQQEAGRDTRKWRRVSAMVKARDGYRCVDCGAEEDPDVPATKLHADLVNPELGGDHRLATVDDCVTRCARCHALQHNVGGWR